MRRQLIVGVAVVLCVVVVIGGLILVSQQGLVGGKAQRLLAQAMRFEQQQNLSGAQGQLEELVATFPDSPWADEAYFKLGEIYEWQQQFVEAREMYRMLLERFPDSPILAKTQQRLGSVNIALLFSATVTELDSVVQVQAGETLGKIAADNNTTIEFIQKANGLEGDVIHPKQELKVPKGRFSIVVDKSLNQLLLTEDNEFIKLYQVATGKNNSTPVGTFTITTKLTNPVWYTGGAVVPPDSPENILGTRWLGIDREGYGIHGSVDPDAMGQQVTAGCVRMRNNEVEELYAIVPVGTEVTIVD